MANPIFEVNYFKWQIFDSVGGIQPVIWGSIWFKNTNKWLAIFTNSASNIHTFTKSLNWTYTVVAFVNTPTLATTKYITSFSDNTSISVNSNTSIATSSWTVYVNWMQTTAFKSWTWQSVVVAWYTMASITEVKLFRRSGINPLNWYCSYFAIYSGTLTQTEINSIQKQFLSLQPIQPPKTNFIKEANRWQVNFDLNIAGNNYVTVNDANSLHFWTGSFSVYWEDRYPQVLQAWWSNRIIEKDSDTVWFIIQAALVQNNISYSERWWLVTTTIASNIPNWDHKFLLQRDTIQNKIFFYCDWVLVSTINLTPQNLTNATAIWLKARRNWWANRTSWNFRNLRMWNTVKTWSQAIRNDRIWQVLDLPMNEWQWLTCYDKSGNNNNWTITSTTWRPWKKIQVKNDVILNDHFDFDKSDWVTWYIPRWWIKIWWFYKLLTNTTWSWLVKKYSNYMQTVWQWVSAYVDNYAYWTWEFVYSKESTSWSANTNFAFIANATNTTAINSQWYAFRALDTRIALSKINWWSTVDLMLSASSYVTTWVDYGIKITRDIIWTLTMYIKWWSFGNNYVLMTPLTWTNPRVDNTYKVSNFWLWHWQIVTTWDMFYWVTHNSQVI